MPPLALLDLARLVYPSFRWAAHHRRIAEALTDVARGKVKRLQISCPPQHAKSTLARLFVSWLLMSRPSLKLMLLSYSKRLAANHSVAARDIVKRWGPALFGPGHVSVRQDSRARDLFRTHKDGYLIADSIQGSVTGFSADGVIVDDVYKSSEDSGSEVIRETVEQVYSSVVETRLAPAGFVVLISTPWHENGLPQKLARSEPGRWSELVLPALGSHGEALWPERYDAGWLAERRRQYEALGQSHLWSALYMMDPREGGGRRDFPAEWVSDRIFYERLPADDPVALTVMAVDPSLGRTGGDYSAVLVVRLTQSRRLYVEADVQRRPVTALEGAVVETYLRVTPQALAVESNAFAAVLCDNLRRKLLAREPRVAVNIHPLVNTFGGGAAKPRIRISLTPLLSQGRVRIKDDPGGRLTREQLREYPGGSFDDAIDALELGTQMLNLLLTGARRPEHLVLRA